MAYQLAVSLLALWLLISMSSVAHAVIEDVVNIDRNTVRGVTGINQLTVVGFLKCPFPAPNSKEKTSLAGTQVTFSCNNGKTYLGQAVTKPDGFFRIFLSAAKTSLFDAARAEECGVFAGVPPGGCSAYPGRLVARLVPQHSAAIDHVGKGQDGHHDRPSGAANEYGTRPFEYY